MKRLSNIDIVALLAGEDTILTQIHAVGTSGKHLNAYLDKDMVGMNPLVLDQLAYEMAYRIIERTGLVHANIVAVIGAPMGAIAFGHRVTFWLNKILRLKGKKAIKSIFAEKDGKKLKLRDKFAKLISGRYVISMEDILNTGGTGEELTRLINECCGTVFAVGAIGNRGGVTANQLGTEFLVSLMDVKLDAYTPEECPMCKDRVPMRTDIGHGKKFIEEQAALGIVYPVA